jgi:hypothetical protein
MRQVLIVLIVAIALLGLSSSALAGNVDKDFAKIW